MAGNLNGEIIMEDIQIIEEVEEETLESFSSSVEETCTEYVHGEDVKMENTEIQGNVLKIYLNNDKNP